MTDPEMVVLLREIRDLLAGQERVLERHYARIQELIERENARTTQLYQDNLAQTTQLYQEHLAASRRYRRNEGFANFLFLFITVAFAAAIGAHWGR